MEKRLGQELYIEAAFSDNGIGWGVYGIQPVPGDKVAGVGQ